MPTILDSFIIEFGLDPSKFTKGQKEVLDSMHKTVEGANQSGKQVETQGKKLGEFLGNAKRGALGLLGLFLGGFGLKQFASYISTADADIGRMSKNLALSTSELSAWQNVFEQIGGTAEQATGALSNLTGQINRFRVTGQTTPLIPILGQLGIDILDKNKHVKNAGELLLEISRAVQGRDRGLMNALLGEAGLDQTTINLVLQGEGAIRKMLSAAREAGDVTDEAAEAAARYQKELALLERASIGVGRQLFDFVVPALTAVINKTGEFFSIISGHKTGPTSDELHDKLVKKFGEPGKTTTLEGTSKNFGAWVDSLFDPLGKEGAKRAKADIDEQVKNAADKLRKEMASGATAPAVAGAPRLQPPLPQSPAGVPTKPGAGAPSPATEALARQIQTDVPGLSRFTAFNDEYHAGTGSKHAQGLALDFTLKDEGQSGEVARQIRRKLEQMGVMAKVIDEYKNPSPRSTGGHIHVQLQSPDAARRIEQPQQPLPAGAPAAASISNRTSSVSHDDHSSSNEVNIGSVVVNTKASDAAGIARDVVPALSERMSFAAQANFSLNG